MPEALGPETRLFGEGGLFDSVGLVSLVVAVEEAIQDRMDASVSLADERAMSQKRSPYRTISSLAEYARTLLEELSSKAG
jgi:acyl carrier protein